MVPSLVELADGLGVLADGLRLAALADGLGLGALSDCLGLMERRDGAASYKVISGAFDLCRDEDGTIIGCDADESSICLVSRKSSCWRTSFLESER